MAAARSVAVEPAGSPRVDPSGNLIVQLVGHGAGGYRVAAPPLERNPSTIRTLSTLGQTSSGLACPLPLPCDLARATATWPVAADGKPSAFLVAYSSTYSWPLSSRISYMTSSMIWRSTRRSSARSA